MPESADFITICKQGTRPMADAILARYGYSVKVHPAHESAKNVSEGKIHLSGYGYRNAGKHRKLSGLEINVLSSWADMLQEHADAPFGTVFADAYPVPSPGITRSWLDVFLSAPITGLYDVIVLGCDIQAAPCLVPPSDSSCVVDSMTVAKHVRVQDAIDTDTAFNIWGAHALWVHPAKRAILEEAIRQIAAPFDISLYEVALSGVLRIGKCLRNLFFQQYHVTTNLYEQ